MESYLNLWVNFFYQYQRKYVILKDFILSINDVESKTKEKEFHIKFLSISEHTHNSFKLDVTLLNDSIVTSFFFKCENEEDSANWLNAIKSQKFKYEKFLDEFYINNNSEKIFMENYSNANFSLFDSSEDKNSKFSMNTKNFSFLEFFQKIQNFLYKAESDLEFLNINYRLENILDLQDILIKKIDFYLDGIEKVCLLNEIKESSQSQNILDEDKTFLNKFKDLKTLFDELRVMITDCTFGINSVEINFYIKNFKEKYLKKIKEVFSLSKEIQNCVKFNLNYHTGNDLEMKSELELLKDEDVENMISFLEIDDENYKLFNQIITKQNLKYKISDLEKQNEIIKQFMDDLGNYN